MVKKTINLGQLKGKVLLFGGVYSNLQALEALIAIAEKENISPTQCICTGDIIGYCAQPEEVAQRFQAWGVKSIIGNVEEQLRSGALDCGCDFKAGSRCDNFSKEWYPYAQQQLSTSSIEWMQTLPDFIQFQLGSRNCTVVHGSYHYISEFIFKSTPWVLKQESFDATQSNTIIAGHAGLPFADEQHGQLWINAGVIGMPANNGQNSVWYAILDERVYQFHQLDYDFDTAQAKMYKFGLPKSYAKTLGTGIWDNMEILPLVEKQQQGQKIAF